MIERKLTYQIIHQLYLHMVFAGVPSPERNERASLFTNRKWRARVKPKPWSEWYRLISKSTVVTSETACRNSRHTADESKPDKQWNCDIVTEMFVAILQSQLNYCLNPCPSCYFRFRRCRVQLSVVYFRIGQSQNLHSGTFSHINQSFSSHGWLQSASNKNPSLSPWSLQNQSTGASY